MKRGDSFPWRDNNSFQLLVDGEIFYPRMLATIEKAQEFIFIEQYLVSSGVVLDQFILNICNAARRGVTVFIIFDDYGASGISKADLAKLVHQNIHIILYNPFRWTKLFKSLQRNHRKLLLVDNVVFVGGAGLTDQYLLPNSAESTKKKMTWHDIMLEIQGQVVADWYQAFAQLWNKHSTVPLPTSKTVSYADLAQTGQVLLAHGPGRNNIIKSALRNIHKCQQRIWIATPYFVTTRKLRHALNRSAKRGIDVRLLLPGSISDHPWVSRAARRYYHQLLRNGIKIYEYQPRFIHAKIILIDDWVSIGSSNLDRWSQFWNLDANQAVRDTALLSHTCSMFEADFKQSKLITFTQWKQRPLPQRILEWWSSYIVRIIQWLVYLSARSQGKDHFD